MNTDIESLKNTIVCADCMDFLRTLPDKCIDLVLTDPPYGMQWHSGWREEKHKKIIGDNNLDWLPEWLKEIARVIKDDAHLYIFCSWHKVDVFKAAIEKHFPVKNILIWCKNNFGSGDLKCDYAPQYEMIVFCNPNGKPLHSPRESNILYFKKAENELHPTQKPIPLFSHLIQKSTEENALVLDPFSGSGTTAIACHNLGRRFICIEKDPDYHAASVARLKEHQKQLLLTL